MHQTRLLNGPGSVVAVDVVTWCSGQQGENCRVKGQPGGTQFERFETQS